MIECMIYLQSGKRLVVLDPLLQPSVDTTVCHESGQRDTSVYAHGRWQVIGYGDNAWLGL